MTARFVMTARSRRLFALALGAAFIAAACGGGGGGGSFTKDTSAKPLTGSGSSAATTAAATTAAPTTAAPATTEAPPDTEAPAHHLTYDEAVKGALDDVQAYWRTTFPEVFHQPYQELSGGIYPMTEQTTGVPGCGTATSSYADVEGNAFYCSAGDFIAYDDEKLLPGLYRDFGNNGMVPAVALAHEFGHAVQYRAGIIDDTTPTIVKEQQADCFAGAWVRNIADGKSPTGLGLDAGDLDQGVGGLIEFRDEVGSDVTEQGAHGSGFDRVRAFQEGYDEGPSKCAGYTADNLPILRLQFKEQTDADSGGNLPVDQAVDATFSDLERFWKELFAQEQVDYTPLAGGTAAYHHGDTITCGDQELPTDFTDDNVIYCPAKDAIGYDADFLATVDEKIGDFAIGILLGGAWADAMQTRLGVELSGKDRSLQADCLTGVWTADVAINGGNDEQHPLSLSPGDLDEGITAFLAFGDDPSVAGASGGVGTAFERTARFRAGFVNGLDACGAAQ